MLHELLHEYCAALHTESWKATRLKGARVAVPQDGRLIAVSNESRQLRLLLHKEVPVRRWGSNTGIELVWADKAVQAGHSTVSGVKMQCC